MAMTDTRDTTGLDSARALLDELAREPRPAGGEAEARARARCRRELETLGFDVAEEAFEYSALPGRWATPAVGLLLLLTLAAAGHVGFRDRPGEALAALAAGLLLAGAGAWWVARRGVLDLPWMRRRGVNLEARRGGTPDVWLVAHLDSKSQPVPILVRAAGVVATVLLLLCSVTGAVLQLSGAIGGGWWIAVALLAPVATAPLILSTVGARSPGALDNASGVAAVLLAARGLPPGRPVGVLLTSAEELGLAGARAWARGRPAGTALNCDGVDDAGELVCMYTGGRPGRLVEALRRAGGEALRVRPLVPGILADSVALADAGWSAVTVSRGTARTLSRIHLPADRPEALSGAGVVEAARLLRAAVLEIG